MGASVGDGVGARMITGDDTGAGTGAGTGAAVGRKDGEGVGRLVGRRVGRKDGAVVMGTSEESSSSCSLSSGTHCE